VSYAVGWKNWLTAGRAEVTVKRAGEQQQAVASAATSGLVRRFWSYECALASTMQWPSLRAVRLQHSETDSRETVLYKADFSATEVVTTTDLRPRKGTPTVTRQVCPYGPMDDLQSGIMYVRSQPLNPGDQIIRVIQPFDRPYLTTFTVGGRETRKIRGKPEPCIRLDLQIQRIERKTLKLGDFKKVRSATIWISDDTLRIPLEAHAHVFIGYLSVRLTGLETEGSKD
jgi:hypothetical protein